MNGILVLYGILGNNLGLAIIVLTVILRGLLFPFMKSQWDSSRKLRTIQPQLEKIRKKYQRNPQKIQEEQLKLYRKVGYNPLGCLLSIALPYPILIAIYQVIRAFSSDNVEGIYDFVSNMLHLNGDVSINTKFLIWDLSDSYLPLAKEHGYLAWGVLAYLLLALLTGLSQYFSVKLSTKLSGAPTPDKDKDQKKSKKPKDASDPANIMGEMGKSMAYTFPLMTAFIALSAPAAVALYWISQSWVLTGLQALYYKLKKDK